MIAVDKSVDCRTETREQVEANRLGAIAAVAAKAAVDLNNLAVPASDAAWEVVRNQVEQLENLASTLRGWERQMRAPRRARATT